MKPAYMVCKLYNWSSLEVMHEGHKVPLRDGAGTSDGCLGFMPIFESYAAALAWCHGDATHIRRVEVGEVPSEDSQRALPSGK